MPQPTIIYKGQAPLDGTPVTISSEADITLRFHAMRPTRTSFVVTAELLKNGKKVDSEGGWDVDYGKVVPPQRDLEEEAVKYAHALIRRNFS